MTDTTNSPSSRKTTSISGTVLYDVGSRCGNGSRRGSQEEGKVIVTETHETDVDQLEYQKPAYVAVGLIMAMTAIYVVLPMLIASSTENVFKPKPPPPCLDPCQMSIVESLPENLTYPSGSPLHPSTYFAWNQLLDSAQKSIDLAVFYWTLRGEDIWEDPSDWQGESIYKKLLTIGKERGIKIRIAQNASTPRMPNQDSADLAKQGIATVRNLDFGRLLGTGVLHTKLWVIDGKHLYLGSANMDWRSLTQVKELGLLVQNCSCLAADLTKLFEAYWYLGESNATVPSQWPKTYSTRYNMVTPMHISSSSAMVYLSSSPPPFCARGRTTDIDAIVDVIDSARKFVYVAVMDYFPAVIYTKQNRYWPVIDDALRRAAFDRGVQVRLLASWWNHTRSDMVHYLHSLAALDAAHGADVEVRLFHVPSYTPAQARIPFGRVNHNKYMVTDNTAYIGTSNWSGDYFISTAGIGLIVNQTLAPSADNTVQKQLAEVFRRDWNSNYSHPLDRLTDLEAKLQEQLKKNEL